MRQPPPCTTQAMGLHSVYKNTFEESYKELENIAGWMGENDCRVLYDYASRVRAGVIVEVGSFMGRSTKIMALASPTSVIYSIDPLETVHPSSGLSDPEYVNKRLHEEMENFNWIHFRKKSQDVVVKWKQPIDLLHIDGDHREKPLREDVKSWLPHVKRGGVVIFHDYAVSSPEPWCEDPAESDNGSCVRGVFESIKDTYFSNVSYPSGFAVGIKK